MQELLKDISQHIDGNKAQLVPQEKNLGVVLLLCSVLKWFKWVVFNGSRFDPLQFGWWFWWFLNGFFDSNGSRNS